MGLVNLNYISYVSEKRRIITERYNEKLTTLKARRPVWHFQSANNYAYYPVIFENETLLLKCMEHLNMHEIFTRRYFYPSLATILPYIKHQNLEVTDEVSKRVLCLPLYPDLTLEEVDSYL